MYGLGSDSEGCGTVKSYALRMLACGMPSRGSIAANILEKTSAPAKLTRCSIPVSLHGMFISQLDLF